MDSSSQSGAAPSALDGTHRWVSALGLLATLTVLAGCAALAPARALAVDRVYWVDVRSNTIAFANLDGSSAGTLPLGTTPIAEPSGLDVDPVEGKIYWSSADTNTIGFAALDGSGSSGVLSAPGAPIDTPQEIAIDPQGRRIYWINGDNDVSVSSAKLDGSGGSAFATGSASSVNALAADPHSRRLYSGDGTATPLHFTALDGSGGEGAIDATSASLRHFASGIAIDAAAARIYWSQAPCCEFTGGGISVASLAGGGSQPLAISGVTVDRPFGVAVDHARNRIYWADIRRIAFAELDGSHAANLATPGVTPAFPAIPVLVVDPRLLARPKVERRRSQLRCRPGRWAADEVAAHLFVAPQSYAYRWRRNGRVVKGEKRNRLHVSATGSYRCQVTARNVAGTRSASSLPRLVSSLARRRVGAAVHRPSAAG